jgi:hypothetical protein
MADKENTLKLTIGCGTVVNGTHGFTISSTNNAFDPVTTSIYVLQSETNDAINNQIYSTNLREAKIGSFATVIFDGVMSPTTKTAFNNKKSSFLINYFDLKRHVTLENFESASLYNLPENDSGYKYVTATFNDTDAKPPIYYDYNGKIDTAKTK